MKEGRSIGVVVPAYNEENLIARVILGMPEFVDRIFIVDDHSRDKTIDVVEKYQIQSPDRIVLIKHTINQGVGGAIISGYKKALEEGVDIVVVMAGDGQMDPHDLPVLLDPVVKAEVDYAKGNRLFTRKAWDIIPHYRYLGNGILSLLTKISSGYWHVADSQCGYTAITRAVLMAVDLDTIYKRYGMPNDLLIKLNIQNFKVRDVSVQPVYNIGEDSGIRLWREIPVISWLLLGGFFRRLFEKYVIKDFHPLVFFYVFGLSLFPTGLFLGLYLFFYRIFLGHVALTSAMFSVLLMISGLQFLLFAMWFDMEYNKPLK